MSTILPPQLERMEAALASHHDAGYFLELAETYRRSGHLQRAVRVLQRGLETHPTSGEGFALLATVLEDEGRHAEALACWQRVLELEPGNEPARRGEARARARLTELGPATGEDGAAAATNHERPTHAPTVAETSHGAVPAQRDAAPGQRAPGQHDLAPEQHAAAPRQRDATPGQHAAPSWRSPGRSEPYAPPPRAEPHVWRREQAAPREPAPPSLPEPIWQPPAAPGPTWPPPAAPELDVWQRPSESPPAEAEPTAAAPQPREATAAAPQPEHAAPQREAAATQPEPVAQPPAPSTQPAERGAPAPAAAAQQSEAAVADDARARAAARQDEPMPWEAHRSTALDGTPGVARDAARTGYPPPSPASESGRPGPAPARPSPLEQAERMLRAESAQVDSMAVAIADMLVGLLEYRDPFFRGGTSLTRLLTAAIAREMGVDEQRVDEIALGAVLRDLGQLPLKGLISKVGTDFSEDAKRQVERHVDTALELLEGIELPETVRLTIRHHHERWDGTGYPDRLAGDAIPLGARIVAVADTFAAMIAARPHRLPKRVPAALDDIRAWSGSRYDPGVVDALLRAVATSDWRGLGFGLRHHLILVDPDETRAMVLATRLCSHGYLAEAAFSVDGALERMNRARISGMLVSADLPDGEAMRLLREVRDATRLGMIPIIMTETGVSDRVPLLESGADVCLPRGSSFEEMKATFEAFLRREGKTTAGSNGPKAGEAPWTGLQGDIEDFPLSWLLQVLNYDARTAAVFIVGEDDEGAIYLEKGHPRHAQTRSLSGEAAVRSMLKWSAGSFSVDPDAKTDDLTIRMPLMNMLLDQAVAEDHAAFFGSVRTEP